MITQSGMTRAAEADAANRDLPHGARRSHEPNLPCLTMRIIPSFRDQRQHMAFRPIETSPLRESELDTISGGRTCNHAPPRMEVSIPFGGQVLVIWATSTCSGTYWYVK